MSAFQGWTPDKPADLPGLYNTMKGDVQSRHEIVVASKTALPTPDYVGQTARVAGSSTASENGGYVSADGAGWVPAFGPRRLFNYENAYAGTYNGLVWATDATGSFVLLTPTLVRVEMGLRGSGGQGGMTCYLGSNYSQTLAMKMTSSGVNNEYISQTFLLPAGTYPVTVSNGAWTATFATQTGLITANGINLSRFCHVDALN